MAAAGYFLRLWGYTLQTGDVAAWDAVSQESCEFCAVTRSLAISGREAGEVFIGGDITPGVAYVRAFDEATGIYPVDVDFTQVASERRDMLTGDLIAANPAHYGVLGVDVVRLDGAWKLHEVAAPGDEPESARAAP